MVFKDQGGYQEPQLWWENYDGALTPWAPDVRYNELSGKYFMYYSMTTWGSQRSGIGLATSESGEQMSWLDHGQPLITSDTGAPFNAIDPQLFVDHEVGRAWLTFGSHYTGIYQVEVDRTTGIPFGPFHHLVQQGAHDWSEAPDLIRMGGYYYLFFSRGKCCVGTSSDYRVLVGRSRSPNGPFVDRDGLTLLRGGGSPVLASHGWVIGPGGGNVQWDPYYQENIISYSFWDQRAPLLRRLGLNRIDIDRAGWPYVH